VEGKYPNSDNMWNARKFEYLGELEARIENTLDGYSGALMGSVHYHCGEWSEELNSRILLLAYMVYL
jgi:hypothetical protein